MKLKRKRMVCGAAFAARRVNDLLEKEHIDRSNLVNIIEHKNEVVIWYWD